MMAMNMSKEVLTAFGLMDIKFSDSTKLTISSNEILLANLIMKGEEKPKEFGIASNKAREISRISDEFYNYLETQKVDMLKAGNFEINPESGKLPFEEMDKTDLFDKWFTGDRLSKSGAQVMAKIEKYKSDIKDVLGVDTNYKKSLETFDYRFNTEDVKRLKDGVTVPYLDYHYKGYPAIASYTKLSAMQNDVKVTEASMYNLFLGNTLEEEVTLKNYKAIVLSDKSAFFAGEKFQGKVVLGKYANVIPTKLEVQGREVNIANAIDDSGAATLNFDVGGVGEKEINGKFTFLEDGKPLEIPITGNYVVVPRPKEASVAADKMNVVYRDLPNPITVSVAGVTSNNLSVSAPGLSSLGNGKYNLTPSSGTEVIVRVKAELEGGTTINDQKVFRIKEIPRPQGQIAGVSDGFLNKRDIITSRVLAEFSDFVYDLDVNVTGFVVNIDGKAPIPVTGSRMNEDARAAINSSKRGSKVVINQIKTRLSGGLSNVKLKTPTPIIVTLKN